jgi:hypothetical protein
MSEELTEVQRLEQEILLLEAAALLEKQQRVARARELVELAALEQEREQYRTEQERNAMLQRRLNRMQMLDPFTWADGGLRSLSDAE